MVAEKPKHLFQVLPDDSRIDEKNGVIRKVSLIALGEARGHRDEKGRQVYVDATTLDQVFDYCKALGSIKIKADHGGGVFTTIGYADNFKRGYDRVLADAYIYESEEERPKIFEIARKNPEHIGMSLEFSGEDEVDGEKCLARCEEVCTVALVSDPAANKSLFEKYVKSLAYNSKTDRTTNMAKKNLAEEADKEPVKEEQKTPAPTAEERLAKLEEAISGYETRMKALEDGSQQISNEDADKEKPKATDPNTEPVTNNPDTTFGDKEPDGDEDKKLSKLLEAASEKGAATAIKAFAAKLGVSIPAAGSSKEAPAKKTFAELLDAETKRFEGDKEKAMLFCIKNYPTEYAAQRPVSAGSGK